MKFRIAILAWLLSCASVSADVRVTQIFSDNMILQQQTTNSVWGFADPGEKVTVSASWGAKSDVVADTQGNWKVMLETPAHGTGHTIVVESSNRIQINEVAIGEVWLCAGQSNMGWALGNTFGGEDEARNANAPDFRIFKSSREHWHEPLQEPRDRLAKWSPCDPKTAAATSAVSYYFGKKLHDELGIPVGIIVQAYAGTPIEGWMPEEIQTDDPRTKLLIEDIEKKSRRFSSDEALKKFNDELIEYNAQISAGDIMLNKVRERKPPMITKPANLGHQCPAHIFNAMIYPIRPYGIRGAIWYQGERNAKNVPQALNYRSQLEKLIGYYRQSWHQMSDGNVADDFPFYFTQLPSWNPPQEQPVEGVESPWVISREMMRLVASDVPSTGFVVSIDTGDPVALHPKNKKPIGLRHAYLALKQTYGKPIVGHGPHLRHHEKQGDQIRLHFDSVGGGLVPAHRRKLDSFAIAGTDQQWHWADASIDGDSVVVSSSSVSNPVAVRYAWAMNPSQRNLLYNLEGFPASPFRTDDWPLFRPGEDEEVEVNKPDKSPDYESKDWNRPAMTQKPNGS